MRHISVTSNHNRAASPALLAAAAVAIGHSLKISLGTYDPIALAWLALGMVLAALGLTVTVGGPWLACSVCIAGSAWQIIQMAHSSPGGYLPGPAWFYWRALPILAIAAAGAVWPWRLSRTIFVPLLLAVHFLVGAMLLRRLPEPVSDVYEATKEACAALSHGQNPYAIDFPDVYAGHPEWQAFEPPGVIRNGRIEFGYPYMPVTFAVAYLGHLLGGDFRLGNLAAITLAGGLLAYARTGYSGAAAACLLLLTPPVFYIAWFGWSDPVVLLCTAMVVFCACRMPRLLPWAVGLMLVSKQHMILAAPAALLLLPKPWQIKTAIQFIAKAAIAGAVVTLPLVLWNVQAFWHSAIALQLNAPFRADSLNFAAAWVRAGHFPPPQWLAFDVAMIVAVVAVWRARRSPAGFAAAVAVIYLFFFATAKQAFCNYYFLTIGILCCAVAVSAERCAADPPSLS
jgi:hypothetical protein